MILELLLWTLLLLIASVITAKVVFWAWWTMGEPMPIGDGKQADFVQGRILSTLGRRLCDWYEHLEGKQDERIEQIAKEHYLTGVENEKQKALIIQDLDRKYRKPNIAKAFGVCPPCFGTYVSMIFCIAIIALLSCFYSIWFLYLSPIILIYFWASTLTFLTLIKKYI